MPGRSRRTTRAALEAMSVRVGVPITEYIRDRHPVINGKCYMSFRQAYQHLYNKTRKGTQR